MVCNSVVTASDRHWLRTTRPRAAGAVTDHCGAVASRIDPEGPHRTTARQLKNAKTMAEWCFRKLSAPSGLPDRLGGSAVERRESVRRSTKQLLEWRGRDQRAHVDDLSGPLFREGSEPRAARLNRSGLRCPHVGCPCVTLRGSYLPASSEALR